MAERVHQLKTWPTEFAAIISGAKRVDLRRDDHGFLAGDKLVLDEFDPDGVTALSGVPARPGAYTGRFTVRWVTHVQPGGRFGLAPGWAALSLSETPPAAAAASPGHLPPAAAAARQPPEDPAVAGGR